MAFACTAWIFSSCWPSLFSRLDLDLFELEAQTASANAQSGNRPCPPPRGTVETVAWLSGGEESLVVSARDQAQKEVEESLTASSQLANTIRNLSMATHPQAQQALDRDEHGLPIFATGTPSEESVHTPITSPRPVPPSGVLTSQDPEEPSRSSLSKTSTTGSLASPRSRPASRSQLRLSLNCQHSPGFSPSPGWPLSSTTSSPTRECLVPESEGFFFGDLYFGDCSLALARSDKLAGEGTRWSAGCVRGGHPQVIQPRPEARVRPRAASIISCSSDDDEYLWDSSSSVTLVPAPSLERLEYGKVEPFARFAVPPVISVL
ncbi:hypothetical protein ACJZ2D_010958 [Fusarium nematophilum]